MSNNQIDPKAREALERQRLGERKRIVGRVVDLFPVSALPANAVKALPQIDPTAICGTCRHGRRFEMKDGVALPIAWPASVTPPGIGDWVQCQVKREPWKYHAESAPCELVPVQYEPR